jgi:murein DD-endopeptidase MepM/ murein hydrolase activator NlpD
MSMPPAGAALALAAMLVPSGLALAVQVQAPASPAAPAPPAPDPAFRLYGEPAQGALIGGIAPPGTASLTLDGTPVDVAPDGNFIAGFDRDQGANALLVATLADGREVRRPLAVAPRAWAIEHINVARGTAAPDEAYRKRREAELARIAKARALAAPSLGWRQRFTWPAKGRISGRFGAQRIYRGEPAAFHSGLDIAPGAGALVVAPADGRVVLAGPPIFSLEGNLVIIDHGMGLNSAFLHLASTSVREGQDVKQGQPIGTVGATGRATGPHLHWSVKWKDARVDPLALVR